jgi:HAD superfamily hydrolase (TIGR01509 family)
MIDLKNIKNIILDLGKVFLKINLDNTIIAFKKFGFPRIEELDIVFSRYPFFKQFELGLISPGQFIFEIRKTTDNKLSDESILEAWNSMIGEYYEGTIPLIQQLGKKYRIFLLSNTNEIHEKEYNRRLKVDYGIENLSLIFEKVYYSHTIHLSKPDPAIFKYVLDDKKLVPEEILFIDDILINTESAAKLGIKTFHLEEPLKLTDIFRC